MLPLHNNNSFKALMRKIAYILVTILRTCTVNVLCGRSPAFIGMVLGRFIILIIKFPLVTQGESVETKGVFLVGAHLYYLT